MDDNRNGVLALVFGIVAVVVPIIGFITAILALVFASKQRKVQPNGFATAGIVLGIIGLVLNGIVLILFLIGMLAYFGTMSPQKFVPDRCTVNPPFSCKQWKVTGNDVFIMVGNYAGMDVIVQEIGLSCDGVQRNSPDGFESLTISNGNSAPLRWTGGNVPNGCLDGNKINANFTFTYTRSGETTQHVATGTLQSRVET